VSVRVSRDAFTRYIQFNTSYLSQINTSRLSSNDLTFYLVFGYVNKNDVIFFTTIEETRFATIALIDTTTAKFATSTFSSGALDLSSRRRTRRQLHSDLATRRGAAPCAHRFLNRTADVWGWGSRDLTMSCLQFRNCFEEQWDGRLIDHYCRLRDTNIHTYR